MVGCAKGSSRSAELQFYVKLGVDSQFALTLLVGVHYTGII